MSLAALTPVTSACPAPFAATSSFGYSSDRLQMTSLSYAKSGTPLFGLSYYYKTDSTNCSAGASGDNGQIQCISDTVDSGRTAHYTYDAFSRLSTAATTGSTSFPAWGLSWTYDRYGNRTAQSIASGCTGGFTCPTSSISVSATTNQLTGSPYTYDANGNITNDGLNSLVYNAENQLVTINSGSNEYQYDGNGTRVKKCTPNCSSPTSSTIYLFNGQQVLAEYDNGAAVGSPTREYLYSGAALLARFDGSTLKYYQQDHLSNRLITDSSGSVLEQKGQFPFGEDWYQGGDKWKFTTYERDSESGGTVGNDYAMARYYISRGGRFNSPDPAGVGAHAEDPQTWNAYTYAGNDPILNTDPKGLDYYLIHIYNGIDSPAPDWNTLMMLINGVGFSYLGGYFSGLITSDTPVPNTVEGDYIYKIGNFIDSSSVAAPTLRPQPQQSFATCVAEGGKIFSVQGVLQFVSGGHLGNGFLSDAFLGNSVSAGIEAVQAGASHDWGGTAKALAPELVSHAAGPVAVRAAGAMPNIAVGISVTRVTVTSSTLTVESVSAAVSLKGLAKVGAVALKDTLKTFEAPKLLVDGVGAGFAAVICGIMR